LFTTHLYEGLKPVRFSGPYRAERAFMFTQAKAWAEFSWPFGPRAAPAGKPRASHGFCGPKGREKIGDASGRVRFPIDDRPEWAAENGTAHTFLDTYS
jgi:hypothetical protein